MKQLLGLLILGSLSFINSSPATADESVKAAPMLKAVVHVNYDDADRQEHGLGNLENVLNEVGDEKATLEVVCHGKGLSMLVRGDSKLKAQIAALQARKVKFVACENTMKKEKVTKDQLLDNVETTASGAVEVLRKQQDGYGYFRP